MAQKKVILKGYILVPLEELSQIQQHLPKHIELTKKEAGCLTFSVTQSQNEPRRFDVYEEFVDEAAFKHHQQRVENSQWGRVTERVERHYQVLAAC